MKMTSAQAAKELKKLNDQYDALIDREKKVSVFTVATQEEVESVRPEYDYEGTQEALKRIEGKIRSLKHAINCFNLNQVVPGFDMTIDQMLVYIPQLTRRKKRLDEMRSRLPKERVKERFGRPSALVEYNYSNYDIKQAEEEYMLTVDELAKAQTALDTVNTSVLFEVDY